MTLTIIIIVIMKKKKKLLLLDESSSFLSPALTMLALYFCALRLLLPLVVVFSFSTAATPAPTTAAPVTTASTWNQLGSDIEGRSARLGGNNRVAVSLKFNNTSAIQVYEQMMTVEDNQNKNNNNSRSSNATIWKKLGEPSLYNTRADDQFKLNADGGNRIVLGIRRPDETNPNLDYRWVHVRVHEWDDGVTTTTRTTTTTNSSCWKQLGPNVVTFYNHSRYDHLSVDISNNGNRVVVGSNEFSHGSASAEYFFGKGTVQVFDYDADLNEWVLVGGQPIVDLNAWYFGRDVDLAGGGDGEEDVDTTVAISAYYNRTPSEALDSPLVLTRRVYRYSTTKKANVTTDAAKWNLLGGTTSLDAFSYLHGTTETYMTREFSAISNDGNLLAIGAACQDGTIGWSVGSTCLVSHPEGRVRVFEYHSNADEWSLLGQELFGEYEGEEFGHVDLAVDEKNARIVLAVGARAFAEERGRVQTYYYENATNMWVLLNQEQYHPDQDHFIVGDEPGDRFGQTIALSPQGNRLLVGGRNFARLFEATPPSMLL